MQVSINITNYSWPGAPGGLGPRLDAVVRAADEAGIDTVWVNDHLLQADPTRPSDADMLEAYTTLGFLAARTQRVRLGTMVSAATYRPPALLVKAVTTLDVLSGGRAWLGIGAGYHDEEARALDLPFPSTTERFERLAETLRLAIQMWSGDESVFKGEHYWLARPVNLPGPVSRPHPPILVGGTGERWTLRLVAQYADACNLYDIPDGGQTVRHKLAVLAEHCAAVDRPYGDIEKTLSTRFDQDRPIEAFVQRCAEISALGIEHVVLITGGPWSPDAVSRLGAALPAVQQADPALRA